MEEPVKPQKKLVSITIAFFALIIGVTLYTTHTKLPEGILINTKGQPTIGYPKAKVRVVVFEEPKCVNCQEFNNTIFPKIKKTFIDTNKILYTVIPVSFLPNSMPAAESLLCVYLSDPLYPNNDLFFTFLDYIYIHQPPERVDWASTEKLLEFAKSASPAINLDRLRTCVNKESYRTKIDRNTSYGSSLMGGVISTPGVYVDGIKVDKLTYDEISTLIIEVLEKKGIHLNPAHSSD